MKLRDIITFEKLKVFNDGSRMLLESIAVPEVEEALKDWIYNANEGVLIGGCAASYHGLPRATMDVDILFLNSDDIPKNVNKFKRIRNGSFQHNNTHVEVEVISPDTINISNDLAKKIFQTCEYKNGCKIASPSGIVALKLQRLKNNDIGDIVTMIKTGKVDLKEFPLSDENLKQFEFIKNNYV